MCSQLCFTDNWLLGPYLSACTSTLERQLALLSCQLILPLSLILSFRLALAGHELGALADAVADDGDGLLQPRRIRQGRCTETSREVRDRFDRLYII